MKAFLYKEYIKHIFLPTSSFAICGASREIKRVSYRFQHMNCVWCVPNVYTMLYVKRVRGYAQVTGTLSIACKFVWKRLFAIPLLLFFR